MSYELDARGEDAQHGVQEEKIIKAVGRA